MMQDHERGCACRTYNCTCGYDNQQDALIRELVAALDLYGMAAHTDVTMEGVHLIGVNRSAFKRAWDVSREVLAKAKAAGYSNE